MRITERHLYLSGLPRCWAAAYQALRPAPALREAVRHTTGSLNRMPAGYRWAMTVALRSFPMAFHAVTRRRIRHASPDEVRAGLARLRGFPGYADVLRMTTALALYGALDGTPAEARTREAAG
ncbi:hypothetical protein AB0B12_25560 [Streptomyces sp. NPDC044780]|uniref:Uncharacterized protein n=1 Tax=Streptomyces luomodiensis TaxID=3026192 RepID=A0ABY9UPQ9_9ACTN|nr:hypothetical protein [Streptomyces sp. SCA4-21]WNE93915.1 hypothetical protein PS467_00505 [Streptomyces sp. SCA4-21]